MQTHWAAAIVIAAVMAAAISNASSAGYEPGDEVELSKLTSTLTALESALNFIGRHTESVNLDGIIGIRILEGQFSGLLARYWTRLPVWLVDRLKSLQLLAASIAETATESVKRRTPSYFATAGLVVSSHHYWDTFYPRRPIPADGGEASIDWLASPDEFNEKFSDRCILALSGKGGHPSCSISKPCWEVMAASEGRHGYHLTHQLFYVMSGIQLNCLHNLTAMAASGADDLQRMMDRKCAGVYAEALGLEKLNFPAETRDLFMEQIAVCGTAGYTELAQRRWLKRLLAWQRADQGCYGLFAGEAAAATQTGEYGHNRRRKRAEERIGTRGCLSHRTSVALAALTVFVRRGIEGGEDAEL